MIWLAAAALSDFYFCDITTLHWPDWFVGVELQEASLRLGCGRLVVLDSDLWPLIWGSGWRGTPVLQRTSGLVLSSGWVKGKHGETKTTQDHALLWLVVLRLWSCDLKLHSKVSSGRKLEFPIFHHVLNTALWDSRWGGEGGSSLSFSFSNLAVFLQCCWSDQSGRNQSD